MNKRGYHALGDDIFTLPLSRDLRRDINCTVAPRQIVYLGDYLATLKINVRIQHYKVQKFLLYPYNQFKLSLDDQFEHTKEVILTLTKAKAKRSLDQMEIVSGI